MRLEKSFSSVEYFVLKYPETFPGMNLDQLQEKFLNYQLLSEAEIPKEAKANISDVSEEHPYRIDILWGFFVKSGTNSFEFDLLFKVAEAVMMIPHSNAGEERIFSLINKNITLSRSSLKLDGTLSLLITVKTHIETLFSGNHQRLFLRKLRKQPEPTMISTSSNFSRDIAFLLNDF